MPLLCSNCGTPLIHINEPCPNCLPYMAERPPTESRVVGENLISAKLQKLCVDVPQHTSAVAGHEERIKSLEQSRRWAIGLLTGILLSVIATLLGVWLR